MPIEVELPDGNIAEFPDGTAPDIMRAALQKRFAPDPKALAEAEVKSGENRPDYRPEPMLGERFQRLSDQMSDPFGIQDEMVGAGQFARKLVTSGGDFSEAGKAYTDAAERIRAERRVARGENTVIPEIIGGFGTSGVAKAAGAIAPTFGQTLKQAAKAGAATGGVAGYAQGEGGVADRAINAGKGAAIGAVAGPAIATAIPAAARLWGAGKDALAYGNQAVRNAMNPEQAAINNVADRMVLQGIDPAAVRAQVSPGLSANLKGRNFTEDQLADIVSRGLKGEAASDIGKAYGIHESTVRNYLGKYRAANPTDRNILDIATDMSGAGSTKPLSRLARAAYSLSDDGEAAQRLLTRQETQAGRISNIVDQAGAGRNFDDEVSRLSDVVTDQARKAYAAAEANAQTFDLKPVIGKYRRMAFGKAGELKEQMEKAVDMFFTPTLATPPQPPATKLRLLELKDKLDDAIARDASEETIRRIQRKIRYANAQDEFSRADRVRKVGEPISDMKQFQAARQNLDQMIARSMQDGKPTPLTRQLTQLRQEVTAVVRKANPDLAKADDLFSGAKSSEKLLEAGAQLTGRLGAPSRQLLQGFEKLNAEQQELFRLGFLRSLQDKAGNVREGNAVANQFNSPAVRETIERIFPKAQKDVYKRGQDLIKFLKQEATTTATKNEVLAGSRTAELGSDMGKAMQGAQAAADLATGQVWKVVSNLGTRLSSQIGERGAKEVLEVLTQTDPAKLLPTLNRLAAAAKTTKDRQAYVTAIRELRALNSPRVAAVAGQEVARPDREPITARR